MESIIQSLRNFTDFPLVTPTMTSTEFRDISFPVDPQDPVSTFQHLMFTVARIDALVESLPLDQATRARFCALTSQFRDLAKQLHRQVQDNCVDDFRDYFGNSFVQLMKMMSANIRACDRPLDFSKLAQNITQMPNLYSTPPYQPVPMRAIRRNRST